MATGGLGGLAWKGKGMGYAAARKRGGRWQEHQTVDTFVCPFCKQRLNNKTKTLLPQSNSKRLAHH